MVNEREPPRLLNATSASASEAPPANKLSRPEFGTVNPLRNPLNNSKSGVNVFNIPKPNKPRPEHHKPTQSSFKTPIAFSATYPSVHPQVTSRQSSQSPSIIEVPKPANFISRTLYPALKPVYSSVGEFQDPNAWKAPANFNHVPNVIDLRGDDNDFDPNKAILDSQFGEWDPLSYVDTVQANENIKALLEGAMDEDEDDKPKPRVRKKKIPLAPTSLADKLKALEVKEEEHKVTDEGDDGTVDGLNIKLLPHQMDGLNWMIDKEIGKRKKNGVLPKGGILADDMGLGKTIQALSLILTNPRPTLTEAEESKKRKLAPDVTKCTLVVAPLALIKQWESEIRTKVERSQQLKVLVHHGASRTKRYEEIKNYDVVITTYQTLSSELAASSSQPGGLKVGCFGIHWYRVILDEAHSIKNRNTKMSKAACALEAVYRWCLTGTPMQNNLDELQSLIHFLRIKPYNELKVWRDQISAPMSNGRGGLAIKRIQYFLKAFMKRRTKDILKLDGAMAFGKNQPAETSAEQHGFKIVGRKVETITCHFNAKERVFYDGLADRTQKRLDDMMKGEKNDYIGALVLLLRLRQTCNHPELIRQNLRKERDAIGIGSVLNTPLKSKATSSVDVDDVADMFGALTVETRECNGCKTLLSKSEARTGAIMCSKCEKGLDMLQKSSDNIEISIAHGEKKERIHSRRHDRRILDSDEEEEEQAGNAVSIVPKNQQSIFHVGTFGDTDDENAEGGGEWLGVEDSDTDDEEDPKASRLSHKLRSAEEDSGDDESANEESESDNGEECQTTDETSHRVQSGLVSSTKIRRLLKILQNESKKHKFIVFSEFTSMLDIVEPFLHAKGLRFTRYDGSMRNDEREASLLRLRSDSRIRILLCSLRCGSLGLNLTAASRVILLEPFWNPFVEEQAIDRVHRLNQTVDVVVYRLTIADSVEERILVLQQKKRELAEAAIEGGRAVGKLSMKDILNLFERDAENGYSHGDDDVRIMPRAERLLEPSPTKPPSSNNGTSGVPGMPRFQRPRYYDGAYGRRWS